MRSTATATPESVEHMASTASFLPKTSAPAGALMNSFDGPLVIGYDGAPGGADALALGLGWSRQLSARAVIVTVYPGPAPIGPGRVDVELVADRRREAERLLDEALTVSSPGTSVEFKAV